MTVLGWEKELEWLWARISEKFPSKHRGRLGSIQSAVENIRIPNRILSWTDQRVLSEGDHRHVEISEKRSALRTPVEKSVLQLTGPPKIPRVGVGM